MATRLHAARSRGLERPAWIVQPHIAARSHLARDMDIVIFNEHQMALQLRVLAEVEYMLNEPFPVIVARMRFAGKDKLNRAVPVLNQFGNVLELLEDQRCPLVGSEATRKADGQRVRIEQLIKGNKIPFGKTLALNQKAAPGKLNQLTADAIAKGPNLFVGDEVGITHLRPEFGRIHFILPGQGVTSMAHGFLEFATPETPDRSFHPTHQMNAIGDMANGHFRRFFARIESLPHMADDLSVQLTHAICSA